MSDSPMSKELTDSVEPSSRRDLLTKGAIAAALATVAGAAIARPAAALDGGNVVIGTEGQTAQTPTEIRASGFSGSQVLLVNDNSGSVVSNSNYPGALAGWSGSRNGIYGYTSGTGSVSGVVGASVSTTGVTGLSDSGIGVYGYQGSSTTPGAGVTGESVAGVGVVGIGNSADLVANGSGRVLLGAVGAATPPVGGARGSIARDAAGDLWYCHTDGQWRKLTGATSAGSFHAISPVRVYDSRAAAPAQGAMSANTSRVVSIKDGRAAGTGVVTAANVVPAGASAVTFNVTVTGAAGPNYLSVVPGDAAGFSTSTLNWNGGYDIANGGVVKVDATRQVKLFMGDQGGSGHVIIDITGYYL